MKNIALILTLFVFGITCKAAAAQGTLQFNQVLLISSNPETVPAGKVWKVTGYAASIFYGTSSSTTAAPGFTYFINGNTRYFGHRGTLHTSYNASVPGSNYFTPFWLPAGTSLQAGSGVGEISVIEFNVIP
jgi:hypothetical protein